MWVAVLAGVVAAANVGTCPAGLDARKLYGLRDLFSDKDLDAIIANPVWRALITTPGLYAHNVVPYQDGDEQATAYTMVVDGPLDLEAPLALPAPWVGQVRVRRAARQELWCARAEQGFYGGHLSWLRVTTPSLDIEITVSKDGKPAWRWQGLAARLDITAGRVSVATGAGQEVAVFYVVPPEADTYDVVEYQELVKHIDPELVARPPAYPSTPIRLRVGL